MGVGVAVVVVVSPPIVVAPVVVEPSVPPATIIYNILMSHYYSRHIILGSVHV